MYIIYTYCISLYYTTSKRLPSNIVKPAILYSLLSLRISRSNYVGSLGNPVPKKAHHYLIFTTEACPPITWGVIPRPVPPSLVAH